EAVVDLDARQRALAAERDAIRARIKELSKEVGRLRGRGDQAGRAEALQTESRQLGDEESNLAARYDAVAEELRSVLLRIPNIPAGDAPDGDGPDDNVVLRTVGYSPDAYAEHQRVPHWDIGAELGLLDLERAAKLSGSMFALYRGAGARLLRALTQLALDRHTSGVGAYEEVRPPTFVR